MLLPETLRLHDLEQFDFHYIYFLPWKDQMVENIKARRGKVTCLPANNNLQLMMKARQVANYVRENKIQLIHAHLPWAGILCRIVGKMTGVPVVYTEHNKQERYHFATRLANLATMNFLTTVVAVSNDVAESIRKHKPMLKSPLKTILNGVNMDHFNRQSFSRIDIRAQLHIPESAVVIGTVAVFRFQKRLDLWMEIASKILEHHPETHFLLLGDGPLKSQLLEKRKTLGMEGRIHMPGLQTEVRPYVASMDVYMMSSIFEGLPIALLEAMSMECAIITTDAGGIKEVIRHGTDGLLCEVDQPNRLVEYASELINDSSKRTLLSRQARIRIQDCFSMEEMVKQLEDLYKGLTGNNDHSF
ncbi:glycosyltransferase family 1 protein [Pseudochryseolinea flava]|uniref:Glycosyltransferase family 1 protein n=2 Tax=Pseudochryseolinea flava TaxID=2059302 RepID=A0A364Y575_9BACT|nr:glycosyltransferase family 1 protein [Pseudochryseolinea flava]